jgi:hypothetical protein
MPRIDCFDIIKNNPELVSEFISITEDMPEVEQRKQAIQIVNKLLEASNESLNKVKRKVGQKPQKYNSGVSQDAIDEIIKKYSQPEQKETPQAESNPALRDVESVAKALEGKDINPILDSQRNKSGDEITYLPNESIIDKIKKAKVGDEITLDIAVDKYLYGHDSKQFPSIQHDNGFSPKGVREIKEPIKISIEKIENPFIEAIDGNHRIVQARFNKDKTIPAKLKITKQIKEQADNFNLQKSISEAYHKAKADGSNPELVKAVESLLSKEQTPAKEVAPASKEQIESTTKALEGLNNKTPQEIIDASKKIDKVEYVEENEAREIIESYTHYKSGNSKSPATRWAGWFQSVNAENKKFIVEDIQNDPKLRNAMLSLFFDVYKSELNFKGSFNDFLNTEITLYRGVTLADKKGVGQEGFSAFSTTKNRVSAYADEQAIGKGQVKEIKIKPIDTYGAVNYIGGGEVEVLVPTEFKKETIRQDFNRLLELNIGLFSEEQIRLLEEYHDKEDYISGLAFVKSVISFKPKKLSEAYHKAKKDGSNPELVKAVESLLSNEQTSQTKNDFQYVIDKANKAGGGVKGSGTKKINLSDREAAILNKTIEKLEAKAVANNGATFDPIETINIQYETINGKEQKINTYTVDGYSIKYRRGRNSFIEITTPQGDLLIVSKQYGKTEIAYLGKSEPIISKEQTPALRDVESKSILNSDVDLKGEKKKSWMRKNSLDRINVNDINEEGHNNTLSSAKENVKAGKKSQTREAPLVEIDENGNATIIDGHHRIAEKILDGETHIEAVVDNKFNIRDAIKNGEYEKAISEGKMTAKDAKTIIESAGLEVPKAVESLLSNEQTPQAGSGDVGGEQPLKETPNEGKVNLSTSAPKQSITKKAFTALTTMLKKAFPKVEFIGEKEAREILGDKGIKVNEMRTSDGNVFGFEYKGKIFLDETAINADTPIHEVVGHYGMNIIDAMAKGGDEKAQAIIAKGFSLLQAPEGKAVLDEIKANPAYSNLSLMEKKMEALATIIGREGANMFTEGTRKNTFASKVKDFIKSFYDYIRTKVPTLKDKTIKQIVAMDNKEFIRAIVGDAFRGEIVQQNNESLSDDKVMLQAQKEADSITLKYNGKGQHLAPNGKPSNLTEQQAKIVRTEAFKNWFGDWESNATASLDVKDFSKYLQNKYDGLTTLFLSESNGVISIDMIEVDSAMRKGGIGTSVMNDILLYADINGKEISLIPALKDDRKGTTSRNRLVDFYKRFGFVENTGRNKDFSKKSGSMFRLPKNNPQNASKVVDANGEPLVVYHGTEGVFNEFDRELGSSNSGLKEFGNYFTDNKELAKVYGGSLKEVFLNIRYLPEFDAKGETFEKGWRELEVDAGYKIANNRDAMEFIRYGKFGVKKAEGVKAKNIIDLTFYRPPTESEKEKFIGNTYLVFDEYANQIKLADGTNTTFNPNTNDIRFQIIGEIGASRLDNAEMILNDLNVAKQMESAGKTPKEIHLATSWEKGADKKWRFELPDIKSIDKLIFNNVKKGEKVTLYELVGDNVIFKAYPELKDLKVKIGKESSFNAIDKTITLSELFTHLSAKSTLIHEMQHAVQDIEGFAYGTTGYREMMSARYYYNESITQKLLKENKEYRDLYIKADNLPYYVSDTSLEINKEREELDNRLQVIFDDYIKKNPIDENKIKEIAKKLYYGNAGEVEARNAQRRMNMTIKERKAKMLLETEGIERNQRNVILDAINGIANSDSNDIRFQASPKTDLQEAERKLKEAWGKYLSNGISFDGMAEAEKERQLIVALLGYLKAKGIDIAKGIGNEVRDFIKNKFSGVTDEMIDVAQGRMLTDYQKLYDTHMTPKNKEILDGMVSQVKSGEMSFEDFINTIDGIVPNERIKNVFISYVNEQIDPLDGYVAVDEEIEEVPESPKTETSKEEERAFIGGLLARPINRKNFPNIVGDNKTDDDVLKRITAVTQEDVQDRKVMVDTSYVRVALENIKEIALQNANALYMQFGEDWQTKVMDYLSDYLNAANPAQAIGILNVISTDVQQKIEKSQSPAERTKLFKLQDKADELSILFASQASLGINARKILRQFAQGGNMSKLVLDKILTEDTMQTIEEINRIAASKPTNEELNNATLPVQAPQTPKSRIQKIKENVKAALSSKQKNKPKITEKEINELGRRAEEERKRQGVQTKMSRQQIAQMLKEEAKKC